LISFLQDKITTSGTATEPLYNTDNKAWVKIPMAIGTIYGEIGQLAKQIEICEGLIEKQEDKTNMSHQHALAWLLNQRGDAGDFAKVEEIKRPCTKYMDERVGKGSPQSMSSRRIMAKAVWMQGRIGEAKTLIDELFELIRETRKGKFAVYEESERMMTEEMMEELLKLKPE
jgi:predicted ATPase